MEFYIIFYTGCGLERIMEEANNDDNVSVAPLRHASIIRHSESRSNARGKKKSGVGRRRKRGTRRFFIIGKRS